jgi:hypothetical protein
MFVSATWGRFTAISFYMKFKTGGCVFEGIQVDDIVPRSEMLVKI